VLLCCKGCAGFVVNATAIIPQTDEALRILLAVRFRVRNRLLNIDFRLRWCVNGSHLSLCAVARFEVPERRMDTVRSTRHEPQHPVAPTLQTQQDWSVSKKYTLASRARHLQGAEPPERSCPGVSVTATSCSAGCCALTVVWTERKPQIGFAPNDKDEGRCFQWELV
jgi:hypothetical protein